MIVSVLIIVLSVALFVYWFRYTCLLILSTKTARNYGEAIAEANRLSFPEVYSRLRADADGNLDALRDALEKDYRLLTQLIQSSAAQDVGADELWSHAEIIQPKTPRGSYFCSRRRTEEA